MFSAPGRADAVRLSRWLDDGSAPNGAQGHTRLHNPHTGEKDLVRLPGSGTLGERESLRIAPTA